MPTNRLIDKPEIATLDANDWIYVDSLLSADVRKLRSTYFERALGNPSTGGYVLTSTVGGIRSWVPQTGGGGGSWGTISGTLSSQSDLVAALAAKADQSAFAAHIGNSGNPHSVTKAQVGLGNCDNTSDANKPVSTAQASTIATKAPIDAPVFTTSVTLPGDASSALQAVTKQQLDAIAANVGKRSRVRVATTANITIATALTPGSVLNGVTLALNDLVLVKDQSAPAQNGVFASSPSPARASEFDTFNEYSGSLISVAEGTINPDTLWLCTSNDGGTLGTTSIVFSQFVVAGAGLAANNNFTGQNGFTLAPEFAETDLGTNFASSTALVLNTFNRATLSSAKTLTFSGSPNPNSQIALRVIVTAVATLTIPSCKRNGSVNTAITSLLMPVGIYTLLFRYVGGEWLLTDSVGVLENLAATVAPVTTDDASAGYSIGSRWINTTLKHAWICLDATASAAVWKQIDNAEFWEFAISDETTALTTGDKLTWRAPFAATILAVRASVTTASSSGIPTFNIKKNGTTIFSTKLTIDATEKTSVTAAAAAAFSATAVADDDEFVIAVDVAGTAATGAKVKIYYVRS